MRTELDIKPNMITWAIARAGHELKDFASRFPRVSDWISQKKQPTVKQLEEFSNRVHIPFGYLFLNEPPDEKLPIPFFRSGNARPVKKVSVNLYDTIMVMQQRQDWLKQYQRDNDFDRLDFVGRYHGALDYKAIVSDIRKTIGLEPEWASRVSKADDAINLLTQKIEDAGIIVMFNSVVENNTKRPIEVAECRGFVLVNEFAPLMFVNNADAKGAQLFTIIHELAHIWIGQSAGFDNSKLLPANNQVEVICDRVAAEFLVPEDSFNLLWREHGDIQSLAKHFKVSEIVIARRALDLGKISRTSFFKFYDTYIARIRNQKKASGGDFYATTRKRLSVTFAAHINHAVKTNQLLYRDAYKLTSLKGDTFDKFFSTHAKAK
jgi:Zn-dependent peptidase ImmA (M78 family)